MNLDEFKRKIELAMQVGTGFENPGKGTSVIAGLSDRGISYTRGLSLFYISVQDIFDTYKYFGGSKVNSNNLKLYKPRVFDSKANGHSCNCKFLFMLAQKMGLASGIGGQGVKGSPFLWKYPLSMVNRKEVLYVTSKWWSREFLQPSSRFCENLRVHRR